MIGICTNYYYIYAWWFHYQIHYRYLCIYDCMTKSSFFKIYLDLAFSSTCSHISWIVTLQISQYSNICYFFTSINVIFFLSAWKSTTSSIQCVRDQSQRWSVTLWRNAGMYIVGYIYKFIRKCYLCRFQCVILLWLWGEIVCIEMCSWIAWSIRSSCFSQHT